MCSIYERADRVLAWLGPARDNSAEVIAIVKQMARDILESKTEALDLEWLFKPLYREFLNDFRPESPSSSVAFSNWAPFSQFFSKRPYWKRAWVLQELVLGKHILFICGTATFSWEHLLCIARWSNSLQGLPVPPSIGYEAWTFLTLDLRTYMGVSEQISSYKRARQAGQGSTFEFVCSSVPRLATDPRDKLYSLLGIRDLGIQPDYSKSVEEVYTDAIAVLMQGVSLDKVLSLSGRGFYESRFSLPSWVPDWDGLSKLTTVGPLDGGRYRADQGFSDISKMAWTNGDVLTAFGILVDEVGFVSPLFNDPLQNLESTFLFDLVGGGLRDGEIDWQLVPPGVTRYAASLRTFLEDSDPFTRERIVVGSSSYWRLAGLFFRMLGRLGDKEGIIPRHGDIGTIIGWLSGDELPSLSLEEAQAVFQALNEDNEMLPTLSYKLVLHASKKRHFYTKSGYIGFGHRGLERGDLVCILQGSRLPIILRKAENHFIHVCTCFVLGLMDGEVVELLKRNAELQQFEIREDTLWNMMQEHVFVFGIASEYTGSTAQPFVR
jgi:hypothetical protein